MAEENISNITLPQTTSPKSTKSTKKPRSASQKQETRNKSEKQNKPEPQSKPQVKAQSQAQPDRTKLQPSRPCPEKTASIIAIGDEMPIYYY